jgi:hypothetical protein
MFIPKLNAAFLIFPIKWLFQAVDFFESKKRSSHGRKPKPLPRPDGDVVIIPRLSPPKDV